MEKINIGELLKDCPKGTKLYTTIWGTVEFIEYNSNLDLIKILPRFVDTEKLLYGDGSFTSAGECIIFPSKENRDWNTFSPFKDGDVLYIDCNAAEDTYEQHQYIFILKQLSEGKIDSYCYVNGTNESKFEVCWLANMDDIKYGPRFATLEEKEKFFEVIKDNGYYWNAETKTLEKLIEPKFKVGDKVRYKDDTTIITITGKKDDYYFIQFYNPRKNDYQTERFSFKDQDKYELVPNKFDITTLKPFESRVLVRTDNRKWVAAFYSHYDKDSVLNYCVIGGLWYEQCIPFEGNEHLLNTTNECDDYYKNW